MDEFPKMVDGVVLCPHPQWNGTWWCTGMCTYRFHGYHEVECRFVPKSQEEIKRLREEADNKK
jgi:hypothetical protein